MTWPSFQCFCFFGKFSINIVKCNPSTLLFLSLSVSISYFSFPAFLSVLVSCTYDGVYLVATWRYWIGNVDFERRMCTYHRGVLVGLHTAELFCNSTSILRRIIRCTSRVAEWWEGIECHPILSVHTPRILAYYTNVIIRDHPFLTVVWQVAAFEFVILGVIPFPFIAYRSAVGYDRLDPGIGHDGCGVSTSLSSCIRCRISHYDFAYIVAGAHLTLLLLASRIRDLHKSIGRT